MKKIFAIIVVVHAVVTGVLGAKECIHKDSGYDGTSCICNNEHCDTVDPVVPLEQGQYVMYTSNKAGQRFNKTVGDFGNISKANGSTSGGGNIISNLLGLLFPRGNKVNTITVNASTQYQTINGWGGAFTDSAGININSLTGRARDYLLQSYFSDEGIEYSLCRIPIAGTDFSTRAYSYDNVTNDTNLTHFSLAKEDYEYKIPLIKEARKLSKNGVRLFGSAWTAPPWMKTNNAYSGFGFLKDEYFQTWADYHLKFLEAYKKEGIDMWGITTGNEPINGYLFFVKINSMGWTTSSQSKWISKNLGPTIRNSEFRDIKIMALDDQRFFLPWWPDLLMKDNATRNYIDGIAVHWYFDQIFPAGLLTTTHNHFPEKFLLGTEACVGDVFYQETSELGSWSRGEKYANDIMDDINNWVSGWVDWNMALNEAGGPTYVNNNVDSPIIVNATAQEFYKQPMFYTLGHFSKFVPAGSVRIDSSVSTNDLKINAFLRPDNGTTLVIFNRQTKDINVTVSDQRRGAFNVTVTKSSINTILYW